MHCKCVERNICESCTLHKYKLIGPFVGHAKDENFWQFLMTCTCTGIHTSICLKIQNICIPAMNTCMCPVTYTLHHTSYITTVYHTFSEHLSIFHEEHFRVFPLGCKWNQLMKTKEKRMPRHLELVLVARRSGELYLYMVFVCFKK